MATITEIAGTKQQKKILRTAAYCRVSSDSLDQLHSFAAQVQHYTKAISQNPSMELADIYADEGLTGTKTDKRDDFNRLIADCRKGKIDRVLTKSVSRFARNTVDSLMYARMLKEYGVSILFEKENIDTAYMSSELLLALSGAQAQEESISISKNMRWSVERRMKSGTYLSSSTPYGYKLEEGEFKVVETEAENCPPDFQKLSVRYGKESNCRYAQPNRCTQAVRIYDMEDQYNQLHPIKRAIHRGCAVSETVYDRYASVQDENQPRTETAILCGRYESTYYYKRSL